MAGFSVSSPSVAQFSVAAIEDKSEASALSPMWAAPAASAGPAQDNAEIDRGLEEAREKADRAMSQAWTGLVVGVIGSAVGHSSAGALVQEHLAEKGDQQEQDVQEGIKQRQEQDAAVAAALAKTADVQKAIWAWTRPFA